MTVFLVRHAQAGNRRMFSGPDDRLRPLTVEGRHQTAELVGTLADLGANRVLSSPYRRCMETAAPLAAHLGVELEVVRELEEGTAVGALALVRELAAESAALFSHGDIIPAVLDAIAREDRVELGADPRCQKASVWILEPGSVESTFASATYVPPPHWTKG